MSAFGRIVKSGLQYPLYSGILLQKDLVMTEEHFFTLGREWGILIQKSIPLDSIIAHFAYHVTPTATFATLSSGKADMVVRHSFVDAKRSKNRRENYFAS